MGEFIHLEKDSDDGGIVIKISSIDAFYYRPHEKKTVIYIGQNEFCVSGNQTKEICEMIRKVMGDE